MKEILIAAAMAVTLLAQQPTGQVPAQQKAGLPDSPGQQSQIPDAPKPQTPGIGPVTPGKATTSTSNGEMRPPAQDQEPAVPTSLPSTPATNATPDVDDDGGIPEHTMEALQTLSLRTNFVEVPFTVKDSKGRLVPGLTARDVRVYENNLRQHTLVFTVDPFPLSVAVVIDQSMPFDVMTRVNNALGALKTAFTPYDEVAVFTYNNGPRMQTDFTAGQSARLEAVVERSKATGREPIYYNPGEALSRGIDINSGQQDHVNPLTAPGPGSPGGLSTQQVPRESHTLNDAILMAAQATTKAGRGRRRIVYVISDGKEYGSKAKLKEVIKYLQMNKIAVFATLVGDSSVSGLGFIDSIHLPLMMRDNILPAYTKATGGEFYAEYRTRGIETSFSKITEDVRTQYTIGYSSREPFIDGKFRKIEVRVLRPNLQVIARDGYYPLAADAIRPPVAQVPSPVKPTPVNQ